MTRSRFYALACSLLFVLAFAIGTTPVETAQAPASATGPRIARDAALAARQSKQLTATFVGADTCLACHDDKAKPLERTLHGKSSDPRTPAAAEGCETCHGPGSAHIEDPSDPDLENIDDDGNDDIAHTNEVVEDSSSDLDEERAPKRLRLTSPGDL